MSAVQESYRRTMLADGAEEAVDFDKAQDYTLSNDAIREVYDVNLEISERKDLTHEQMLDAFVLALVDRGMPMEEAEEVCELYDRSAGEFFGEDEDDDMPDEDEFEDEEEEDGTEIYEV